MQYNCKNSLHFNIPIQKLSINSSNPPQPSELEISQQRLNKQKAAHYQVDKNATNQIEDSKNVIKQTLSSKDGQKEIIMFDKNWQQRKNSRNPPDSKKQLHRQFYIDFAHKIQDQVGSPNKIRNKERERMRKMSEQLAKNQLLSIDASEKRQSKKSICAMVGQSNSSHNYVERSALVNNKIVRKKSSYHNDRYNCSINKEENIKQEPVRQNIVNRIDINRIYFDKNSNKNSMKLITKNEQGPHLQQSHPNNISSQSFTHTQPQHKHELSDKSLSNFELLKLHAEQLQKSNIVLGVKQKSLLQNNKKICMKEFVDLQQQSKNILNTSTNANNMCKSTHRSRFKQTLTNRKLTYDNCIVGKTKGGHGRKGSKIMNITMDNMKKYSISNCQLCHLNTQPSVGYADTTIFKNSHHYYNNDKRKSIRTHTQIYNSKYGQNVQLKNKQKQAGEEVSFNEQLSQNAEIGARYSFKNQLQKTGAYKSKYKVNENNKQMNSNKYDNIERERRIHTQMNIKIKNQDDNQLSYALLQQNHRAQQEIEGTQNKYGELNHNRNHSYSQAFVQNTSNLSNLQNNNLYMINNQFIPLANRSVLDKNRHNIKKISKGINRIISNKQTSTKQTLSGMHNITGQQSNSNIDQFIKNKLSIIEISTNSDIQKTKINNKSILFEGSNKSKEKNNFHEFYKENSRIKVNPKQNKSKSISEPSLILQKQKIDKSESSNAARFYRNQLEKTKDKANIIHLDPFLKTKGIQLQSAQLNPAKPNNNDIVIICL